MDFDSQALTRDFCQLGLAFTASQRDEAVTRVERFFADQDWLVTPLAPRFCIRRKAHGEIQLFALHIGSRFAARIQIDLCADTRSLLNPAQLPAAGHPLSLATHIENSV